jgi:hypothetical protein
LIKGRKKLEGKGKNIIPQAFVFNEKASLPEAKGRRKMNRVVFSS